MTKCGGGIGNCGKGKLVWLRRWVKLIIVNNKIG